MPDAEPASDPQSRSAAARGGEELWLRIASALVLAPVAVGAAYLGGLWFLAFWGLAAFGILTEWIWLVVRTRTRRPPVMAAAGVALAFAVGQFGVGRPGLAIIILAGGVVAAAGLAPSGHRIWAGFGATYAGAMLAAPGVLRIDVEYGFLAMIFLFAVVWVTDVAAYFVGRLVGGPKLWPSISPKKTWSGAIAGALAGMVAGLVFGSAAGIGHLAVMIPLSLGLSVVAQLGDLFESAFKRRFGTKDASHLIPGHGGLMDRLDGFLTAAVGAAIVGGVRGGIDGAARGLILW